MFYLLAFAVYILLLQQRNAIENMACHFDWCLENIRLTAVFRSEMVRRLYYKLYVYGIYVYGILWYEGK